MSIWIENKLAPHSYEKTLLGAERIAGEQLVIWVEGSNFPFTVKHKMFGICGGAINTNCGIEFNKEELQYILDNMKEGATLKIAACNSLYLNKSNLQYSNHSKTVQDEFKYDNDLVQIADNSFAPSTHPKVLELKNKNNDL